MSAIGMPRNGRSFIMSAAGYHHSHLVFERQQSQALRGMDWEDRVRPLTPWSTIMVRACAALAILTTMLAIAI